MVTSRFLPLRLFMCYVYRNNHPTYHNLTYICLEKNLIVCKAWRKDTGALKFIEYNIIPWLADSPELEGFLLLSYEDLRPRRESLLSESLLHREGDLPASIDYHDNGKPHVVCWLLEGNFHREGKPSLIKYDGEGNIYEAKYYLDTCESPLTFWEFYEQSTSEDKKTLLRDWLPFERLVT